MIITDQEEIKGLPPLTDRFQLPFISQESSRSLSYNLNLESIEESAHEPDLLVREDAPDSENLNDLPAELEF